jgi:hypothetical protein
LFVNKTNMVTVVATPNSFSKYRGTFILKLPNGCSIFLIPASEPGEYEYTWRAVEGLATGHATLMVDDKPIHYYSGTGAEGSFHAVATIGDQ